MQAILIPLFGFIISSALVKILLALGIGFFTYTGLEALIAQLLDLFTSNMNGIPVSVMQLMNLAGFSQAFSILSAALLARAAIQSMKAFVGAITL